jgi:hypothetical protein
MSEVRGAIERLITNPVPVSSAHCDGYGENGGYTREEQENAQEDSIENIILPDKRETCKRWDPGQE